MLDLRLYAILDPEQLGGHSLVDFARAVVAGGATLVQLRDKRGNIERMIDDARRLKAVLGQVLLIVNDHVEVAHAADADGVHVGPEDMAVAEARRRLGPKKIIGHSIKSVAQADAALLDLIDYAGVGGVYATVSKDNPNPPIGVGGLRAIVTALRSRKPKFPVCGIAGISADNAAAVIRAGADGIAVISALSAASDPAAAARVLRSTVDAALWDRLPPSGAANQNARTRP
jgi:thiamine-phosphate pyrophosphorylase